MNAIYQRIYYDDNISVLIENLTDIISILSTNGEIYYVSSAVTDILGYRPDELIGHCFLNYVTSDDSQLGTKILEESVNNPEKTINSELHFLTKDNQIRILQSRSKFIPENKSKHIYGIAVTSRDITKEREHEKAFLEYQKREMKSLGQTVAAIAATVGARDTYTAAHQKRVADLSVAIGEKLRLDQHRLEGLELAATIHDVGKVKIPADILTKPMKFTEIEYELVKSHAEAGYGILKDIDFPWPIADIVWQHHEQIDGTGYPRGLKGDQILLEAKIIGVADTMEAMTNDRPYRRSPGLESALKEIKQKRGTSYDAAVVDVCTELFERGGYSFPP